MYDINVAKHRHICMHTNISTTYIIYHTNYTHIKHVLRIMYLFSKNKIMTV